MSSLGVCAREAKPNSIVSSAEPRLPGVTSLNWFSLAQLISPESLTQYDEKPFQSIDVGAGGAFDSLDV